MEGYKNIDVIFQIPGGKELKYKKDDYAYWQELGSAVSKLASSPPELLMADQFESHEQLIEYLIQKNKGFATYGKIRLLLKLGVNDNETTENLNRIFREKIEGAGSFSLIDNTYSMQLLKVLPGLVDNYVVPHELRPDEDYYKNLREGIISKEAESDTENAENNGKEEE